MVKIREITETTLTIEYAPGSHISGAVHDASRLARQERKTVLFQFNTIALRVGPEDDPADICARFRASMQAEAQAYRASHAYQTQQRDAADATARQQAFLTGALRMAPRAPTMRDTGAWDAYRQANTDEYGSAILRYADAWARLMEGHIDHGATIADCAEESSIVADTDGITGFMYGEAVVILAQCWSYGESLRQWHNRTTQIGDEGTRANADGGVLNPALLRFT